MSPKTFTPVVGMLEINSKMSHLKILFLGQKFSRILNLFSINPSSISSYTSVTKVIIQLTLRTHAFAFILDDEKVLRVVKSKLAVVQQICDFGSVVLPSILILDWFRTDEFAMAEIWKRILMAFFLVILISICFGFFHLVRVPTEVVCVMNSSSHMEAKSQVTGLSSCRICPLFTMALIL